MSKSFALWNTTIEQRNKLTVVVPEFQYQVSSTVMTDGVLPVAASSKVVLEVTVESKNPIASQFLMYVTKADGTAITPTNTTVEYYTSASSPFGTIGTTGDKKKIKLYIENKSTQNVSYFLGVKGGLVGKEVTLSSNQYPITNTHISRIIAPELLSAHEESGSLYYASVYRSNITKVIFLDELVIPDNAVAVFDVSEDKDSEVMAWITGTSAAYTLTIASSGGVILNPNSAYLFMGFVKTTSFEFKSVDTSQVTSMSSMFYNCVGVKTLDLTPFHTNQVTSMASMFAGCQSLSVLNITNFSTSNVVNMEFMFYLCSSMEILDLRQFNTAKVISMSNMFSGCTRLSNLDVSSFDTSNVTKMDYMFYMCSSMKGFYLAHFLTNKVITMNNMFAGCTQLAYVELDNINTTTITDMQYMFYYCPKLEAIQLGKGWNKLLAYVFCDWTYNQVIYVTGKSSLSDFASVDSTWKGNGNPKLVFLG